MRIITIQYYALGDQLKYPRNRAQRVVVCFRLKIYGLFSTCSQSIPLAKPGTAGRRRLCISQFYSSDEPTLLYMLDWSRKGRVGPDCDDFVCLGLAVNLVGLPIRCCSMLVCKSPCPSLHMFLGANILYQNKNKNPHHSVKLTSDRITTALSPAINFYPVLQILNLCVWDSPKWILLVCRQLSSIVVLKSNMVAVLVSIESITANIQ